MKQHYNKFSQKAISEDDLLRGIDFPFQMNVDLDMKGIEYFFEREKKDMELQAQKLMKPKQLQTDMQAIKMARPITTKETKDES